MGIPHPPSHVSLHRHPAGNSEVHVCVFRWIDNTDGAVLLPLHHDHRRLGEVIGCLKVEQRVMWVGPPV